ncbi:hypothetical protein VTI28DRAFT_374 [Corynascus sepedonium]
MSYVGWPRPSNHIGRFETLSYPCNSGTAYECSSLIASGSWTWSKSAAFTLSPPDRSFVHFNVSNARAQKRFIQIARASTPRAACDLVSSISRRSAGAIGGSGP